MTIPIQAASNNFEFKGLPLGSSLNAFKKANPEFVCGMDSKNGRLQSCLSEKSTYFGRRPQSIWVAFVDGKMSSVEVTIKFAKSETSDSELLASSTFNELKKSIVSKYGIPKAADDASINLYEKGVSANWENSSSSLWMMAGDSALRLHVPDWKTKLGSEIILTVTFLIKKSSGISEEIRKLEREKDI